MARGFGRQRAALKRLNRPATKSVGVDLAGVEDLVKDLARLNRQFGPLISRRMISAALRTIATGVRRRVAGQAFGPGRSAARLRKSIGYRHLKRARKNEHLGKVGFRVGGARKPTPPRTRICIFWEPNPARGDGSGANSSALTAGTIAAPGRLRPMIALFPMRSRPRSTTPAGRCCGPGNGNWQNNAAGVAPDPGVKAQRSEQ